MTRAPVIPRAAPRPSCTNGFLAVAARTKTFPWVALLVIAAAIFTSVTSEFLPTGLLPDIAGELRVSESRVGLLITLFAATVVVSAAPLSALTRRFSRKGLVIFVLLVFVASNVLAGLAPNYELLAGARILGGLAHGLFWATIGAYSAHLVPKRQLGRAVAITSAGATAAFVFGVPLGTALGHALGWRLAFIVIGGIVLGLVLLVVRYLPAVDRVQLATGEIALPARRDKTIPAVVVVCTVVLVLLTGHNLFATYIAPWLIDVGGIDPSQVAAVLFLSGGTGAIGLFAAGVISDRVPRAGFLVATALVALSVTILALGSGTPWLLLVGIGLWGASFGGLPSMLQTRLLHTASPRIRDFSMAFLTTSFNLGIGVGALIGAALLDRTDIRVLPWVYIGIIGLALLIAILGDLAVRRWWYVPTNTREIDLPPAGH
jgi:DHA1 family inner membrane transport protein